MFREKNILPLERNLVKGDDFIAMHYLIPSM